MTKFLKNLKKKFNEISLRCQFIIIFLSMLGMENLSEETRNKF